jgi:hypothetical protein
MKYLYHNPLIEVTDIVTEGNFCATGDPVASDFNTGQMTENDYTGLWGDPD